MFKIPPELLRLRRPLRQSTLLTDPEVVAKRLYRVSTQLSSLTLPHDQPGERPPARPVPQAVP
jgi:hypothetical protein